MLSIKSASSHRSIHPILSPTKVPSSNKWATLSVFSWNMLMEVTQQYTYIYFRDSSKRKDKSSKNAVKTSSGKQHMIFSVDSKFFMTLKLFTEISNLPTYFLLTELPNQVISTYLKCSKESMPPLKPELHTTPVPKSGITINMMVESMYGLQVAYFTSWQLSNRLFWLKIFLG